MEHFPAPCPVAHGKLDTLFDTYAQISVRIFHILQLQRGTGSTPSPGTWFQSCSRKTNCILLVYVISVFRSLLRALETLCYVLAQNLHQPHNVLKAVYFTTITSTSGYCLIHKAPKLYECDSCSPFSLRQARSHGLEPPTPCLAPGWNPNKHVLGKLIT